MNSAITAVSVQIKVCTVDNGDFDYKIKWIHTIALGILKVYKSAGKHL